MDLEHGNARGIAVPIVLVAWVVAVAFALIGSTGSSSDADTAGMSPSVSLVPTPEPTPVLLPTTVLVGSTLDLDSGLVSEPQLRFDAGSTIALSLWSGEALGVEHVVASLARLHPEGFRPIGEPRPVPVDPAAPHVSAELSADALLDEVGAGTYLVELTRADDLIGRGVFQLETLVPEAIEVFPDWQSVAISAGNHQGVRFDSSGQVIAERPARLDSDSGAPASHRATFNGQDYLFITDGIWSTYYLPESDAVRLRDG